MYRDRRMPLGPHKSVFIRALVLAGTVGLSAGIIAQANLESGPDRIESLDYGFRFASSIHKDPVDRGKAQQLVVSDLVDLGRLDQAMALVKQIDGWQRGVAHARIAAALAREGRGEEAESQVNKARSVQARTDGWQHTRLEAHIAEALAALGDMERSSQMARALVSADPRQYKGRSAATVAAGQARSGDLEAALASLGSVEGDDDLMVAWWRTIGYVDLASDPELPRDKQLEILGTAYRSADGLGGWHRTDALQAIARGYHAAGENGKAREILEETTGLLMNLGPNSPIKATLLAKLAQDWNLVGSRKRALSILREAEGAVDIETRMVIELPGVWANVAAGYLALGETRAWQLYDKALSVAEDLVNPRPRALAMVAICRSLGRAQTPAISPAMKTRMDASLESFSLAGPASGGLRTEPS